MNDLLSRLGRNSAAALFFAAFAFSCDGGEKEKAKLAEIQKQADDRVAKIEADMKEKVSVAEKKADDLQAQLSEAMTKAKADAEEEISKAKSDADKLAAEATQAMSKARAAYKESARQKLADLGKETDEVKSKAMKVAPKAKTQVDDALKAVATKRDAAKKEIDTFDTATLETLKSTKAKVDQKLYELKQAVHSARAKVPAQP